MNKYYQANLAMWDEMVAINARSDLYQLAEFCAGVNKLDWLVRREVGEVAAKSLLHLQCHFGMDTLSWAMLGAQVTGVDFSPKAIRTARRLSSELGIPARFIQTDVYDLPNKLDGQFDIVFTSYGAICWLHDLHAWANLITRFLKPGGVFFIAELHPFAAVFESEKSGEKLEMAYDYFARGAQKFTAESSYADAESRLVNQTEYEWQHPLSEIVNCIIEAGLRIEFLHEHDFCCYPMFTGMTQREDGMWVLPNGVNKLPLMFSIRAEKPV